MKLKSVHSAASGYFVLPNAVNVSAALRTAIINENPRSANFLQQELDPVYVSANPASYPLSFFTYLIVPRSGTKVPARFRKAKGRTLSTFIDYALCAGQRALASQGYAPLPRNLVAGGLRQSAHIPGHVKPPTLARCQRS